MCSARLAYALILDELHVEREMLAKSKPTLPERGKTGLGPHEPLTIFTGLDLKNELTKYTPYGYITSFFSAAAHPTNQHHTAALFQPQQQLQPPYHFNDLTTIF